MTKRLGRIEKKHSHGDGEEERIHEGGDGQVVGVEESQHLTRIFEKSKYLWFSF